MKKEMIWRSKSIYVAPLFFVKEGDKVRGVVDYRAPHKIKNENNETILRIDEMFEQIGRSKVFPKIDLKTRFHQIRMKHIDGEKMAFNTK